MLTIRISSDFLPHEHVSRVHFVREPRYILERKGIGPNAPICKHALRLARVQCVLGSWDFEASISCKVVERFGEAPGFDQLEATGAPHRLCWSRAGAKQPRRPEVYNSLGPDRPRIVSAVPPWIYAAVVT